VANSINKPAKTITADVARLAIVTRRAGDELLRWPCAEVAVKQPRHARRDFMALLRERRDLPPQRAATVTSSSSNAPANLITILIEVRLLLYPQHVIEILDAWRALFQDCRGKRRYQAASRFASANPMSQKIRARRAAIRQRAAAQIEPSRAGIKLTVERLDVRGVRVRRGN